MAKCTVRIRHAIIVMLCHIPPGLMMILPILSYAVVIHNYHFKLSHTTVYSRDHKGVGMAHEIISPKKTASISPNDDQAVLVR